MKKVSVFITDLDNTLFDWVDIWYQSFFPMLVEIARIGGLEMEQLKKEIRTIHQQRGTSEYAFLIEELRCLSQKFPQEDLLQKFLPAIEAYREGRRKSLKLYPGIAEGLLKIKGSGTTIVGYTESMAFYSNA